MSAMHWEARRRQQLVDRRLSTRAKQEELQGNKEEQTDRQSISAGSNQPLGVNRKCTCKCKCQPARVEETCSAKIPKRYTSLQYSQQW